MSESKLASLREIMKKEGLDCFIIPSTDPHQSEYVAKRWKSREWISNFSGSAGTLVVLKNKSGLWTDGRYWIQAEKQLSGSEIELFKMGMPDVPSFSEWIFSNLEKDSVVGFDGNVFSISQVEMLKKSFAKKNFSLKSIKDPFDELWKERPSVPDSMVEDFSIEFAGVSRVEKIQKLRDKMKEIGVDFHLFSSLDDIAWLFNIRGKDIVYNPVIISHALVSQDSAFLFVENHKISDEMKEILKKDGVEVKSYNEIFSELEKLNNSSILVDFSRVSFSLKEKIDSSVKIINQPNLTVLMKAIKNQTEIEGMKKAHIFDGVAIVKFLKWIDENATKGGISELSASDKLESFRKENSHCKDLSFDTIAGFGEHGAIIHYSSSKETNVELKSGNLFLVDSGGQYLEGTTDITRTIAIGEPSKEMKRDYTLVLKGHINIAKSKFNGRYTTGSHIDSFARQALWDYGFDYAHGTGHGIGVYLNVHEGPQSISPRKNDTILQKGMMISNEPGLYIEGKYGIRIETIVLVVEKEKNDFGTFLGFETITMAPYDKNLIEKSLLKDDEILWLNNYHKKVFNTLSPLLNEDEKSWLKEVTSEI